MSGEGRDTAAAATGHRVFARVPAKGEAGYDASDPAAVIRAREQSIREQYVHTEAMRTLQQEIGLCYMREGVNHFQNCRPLVQEYYRRLQNADYSLDGGN